MNVHEDHLKIELTIQWISHLRLGLNQSYTALPCQPAPRRQPREGSSLQTPRSLGRLL